MAIVIVSARNWSELERSREASDRAQLLIEDLDAFQSSVTQAETGQRGYLLTNNREYLRPYLEALTAVPERMDALEPQLDPQTAQSLRRLTQAKMSELAFAIRQHDQLGPEAGLAVVNTNRGRDDMERIRGIVKGAIRYEDRVLKQRSGREDQLESRTLAVASIGSAALFVFLCFSSFTIGAIAERREGLIAELRESRAEKEAARHTLEVTLKSIGDAVITTDVGGNVQFLNPVAEGLTGWPAAEAHGKPVSEVFQIVREGTHETVESPVEKVRRSLAISALANHTLLIRRDGKEIPIDDSGAPILGDERKFSGVVMVFRDVSERRRTERMIEESAKRYRQLADSMPQIVWTATPDGALDYGNERWRERVGLLPKGRTEDLWPAVLHPEDLEYFESAWDRTRQDGEGFQVECRVRNAYTGHFVWYLCRAIPVRDDTGAPQKWFGTFTDIDERKRSEVALRQANEDLSQFAYSASHDLQEPLRNVIMFTQLFARRNSGRFDRDSQEMIQLVVDSAKRMEEMMRDLLLYVKAGSAPAATDAPPIDTRAALDKALSQLHSSIRSTNAIIEVTGQLPKLAVDEVHLTQLFQNLIGNSLKYRSAKRPQISIFATPRNEEWVISVRDNGIGIDPQYARQIFGLFKRLHGTEQYPGTGIGLAICQKILERYGGRIWVDANIEQGAQISFSLPGVEQPESDG
ncbi:MAG: PAS domain S-box protein [Bryobacteraceae bacterium]